MELSTKAILLSERFHWKLTCCQGAFNESQLVLGELSIACFRRAFNKSIIFFATDCSINFLSINLIFCNSNRIITTIIPLSVPNTKYNIKYHIHHLEYKIHRSKYSMTCPLSQDPKIRWKWDNRKRPLYSSWSWGSRGSQGSQNPHFEGIGSPGSPRSPGSHGSPYLLHDLQTHVDRSKVKEQLTKFGKVNLANNMLLLMNFQLSLSLIKSSLNLFPNAHADTGYEFGEI